MMKNWTFTESVLLDKMDVIDSELENRRMLTYKKFSIGFSYPDDSFFEYFKDDDFDLEKLKLSYDDLFRANNIWLYCEEYNVSHSFQRANNLSDIMGFYKAFGLQLENERADSFSIELEFLHFLIFKKLYAFKIEDDSIDKAMICLDAEEKFFNEYLYPAACKISNAILENGKDSFYTKISNELLEFLKFEKNYFEVLNK